MGMAAAISVIGGLASAAGSVMQGNAQAAQASYQAQVADTNAELAKQKSWESLKEGAREEEKFKRRADQFAATQLTQLAGSGVQLSGSPLTVLSDTAAGTAEDIQQIRYNALKSMWGGLVEMSNYQNEANSMRASAKNAKRSGLMGAAGSLIGLGASLYGAGHSTYNGDGTIHLTAKTIRPSEPSAASIAKNGPYQLQLGNWSNPSTKLQYPSGGMWGNMGQQYRY